MSGTERNCVLSIAPTVKKQAKMKQKMGEKCTHTHTYNAHIWKLACFLLSRMKGQSESVNRRVSQGRNVMVQEAGVFMKLTKNKQTPNTTYRISTLRGWG